MLRRATLLLVLLPGFALGQTTSGTVTAQVTTTTQSSGQANRAECASTTALATWVITSSLTPVVANGDRWRLATASTSTGCTTSGALPTGVFSDVLATGATQQITSIPVNTMATSAGVSTCTQANDVTVNLCVYLLAGGSTTSWQFAGIGTFVFQMAIPPKPVIGSVSRGDGQLGVSVAPGTVTATETATRSVTYTVTCTPAGGGTAATGGPANAGNIVCGNLTNGTAYTITAKGFSAANNEGPVSDPVGPSDATTPLPFLNFWEVYKSDGGQETGGCGTGGAGALAPVLALLGFLAVRRRRP
jgi:uncharacterized protein (TIGR03382 family)